MLESSNRKIIDVFYPRYNELDLVDKRRVNLVFWGTVLAIFACLPVTVLYVASGDGTRALGPPLYALPFAITLLVLKYTNSYTLAGYYLLSVITASLVIDFGPDGGISVIAMVMIPLIASHTLGPVAGGVWTLITIAILLIRGPDMLDPEILHEQIIWSTAIVAGLIGISSAFIQMTLSGAFSLSDESKNRMIEQIEKLRDFLGKTFPIILSYDRSALHLVTQPDAPTESLQVQNLSGSALSDAVHPEDLSQLQKNLSCLEPFHLEARFRSDEGSWIWTELYALPDASRDGWLLAIRSIEDELEERQQKVNTERLHSVGLLAAGIAHDSTTCSQSF